MHDSPTDKADRPPPLDILLVEDNGGDVYLVREALAESGMAHVLHVARTGESALAYLRTHGPGHESRPDLVILDLNLPGKNGRQVMAEMENDPALSSLPVAVLSTSHYESGIPREFPRLRSIFAAKTADFRELISILRRFEDFALKAS